MLINRSKNCAGRTIPGKPLRCCPIFLATSSLFQPLFPTEVRTEKTAFVRVAASKHGSRSRRNCSFTSSTLSPSGGMLILRRQQVAHSDRAQRTILQPIGVPLLRGLHVAMAKKITHFEDCCAHVEQSGARITTKFVTRFGSSFDPFRNPFRMTSIDSMVPFSLVFAWH